MEEPILEGQIKAIIDTVVDGFIIIDQSGSIRCFNAAACNIFGYQESEVLSQNIRMLMPPPYAEQHDTYLTAFLSSGINKIIGIGREIVAQRKDGSVFPMELSVNQLDLEGTIYFLGTIKDISERKCAEEKLKAALAYSDTLFDTVLDGLITIDSEGRIGAFNHSAEKIFGYSKQEVLGKNVKLLMPEPYQSEHDQYLANYRKTGDKKVIGIGREVMARRKDGHQFPIELGVNEMVQAGQVIYVGTIRDISERRIAEKAIQSYIQKLQLSNDELDQFAYIASHDLKEPLRGLSNNALFLQEDYQEELGEQGVQRLSRIQFLCQRMERLVDSLLYYSRLGRTDLAINQIALDELLTEVMMLAVPEDETVKVSWPDDLPTIVCDVPRTTELFRNLITNAIKYNRSEFKQIEVGVTSITSPNTGIKEARVFFVKDNGIGIEQQFFKDIFRIFKRLNSEDDRVRGTGVGLTFVKKIVERQGGEIWLESTPGKGSCFYFTLHMEEQNE